MKKYACYWNNMPMLYKADTNPELGWTKYIYDSLEEAQDYMHDYLGIYSPGKDKFIPGFVHELYNDTYRILEIKEG